MVNLAYSCMAIGRSIIFACPITMFLKYMNAYVYIHKMDNQLVMLMGKSLFSRGDKKDKRAFSKVIVKLVWCCLHWRNHKYLSSYTWYTTNFSKYVHMDSY